MAVAATRTGTNVTVTVTLSIADISTQPAATIRTQALKRADEEIREAIDVLGVTDVQLDVRVTRATADAQAEVTRLKTRRMTGNL